MPMRRRFLPLDWAIVIDQFRLSVPRLRAVTYFDIVPLCIFSLLALPPFSFGEEGRSLWLFDSPTELAAFGGPFRVWARVGDAIAQKSPKIRIAINSFS